GAGAGAWDGRRPAVCRGRRHRRRSRAGGPGQGRGAVVVPRRPALVRRQLAAVLRRRGRGAPAPACARLPPRPLGDVWRDNRDMKITAGELNRATLGRQLLLGREPLGVADAVRRVAALQAQHPASPYLALWNRLAGFDPADLDAALANYTVVRSTLMRIAMHAVHAGDYRMFREAMEPTLRASRLGDPRFMASGLTLDDADALIPEL